MASLWKKRTAETTDGEPLGLLATQITKVALKQIDFDNTDLQFRVNYTVSDLVNDIQKNGLQFPVILRERQDHHLYQIVSGFRRCNAVRLLGHQYIKAIIRTDLDDNAAFRVSFAENEKRKNLTSIDKAYAIARMSLLGKNSKEIQSLFNIGERQFYRYKKIVGFPEEIRQAISDKFIDATHALVLMEAYEHRESQGMDLDEWIDWIVEERASVRRLKQQLAEVHNHRAVQQKQFLKTTKSGGFCISTLLFNPARADFETVEQMKESLKEAIKILERWNRE